MSVYVRQYLGVGVTLPRAARILKILRRCRPPIVSWKGIHSEVDQRQQHRPKGSLAMAIALRRAKGLTGLPDHRGDEIGHHEPLPLSFPTSRARSGVQEGGPLL